MLHLGNCPGNARPRGEVMRYVLVPVGILMCGLGAAQQVSIPALEMTQGQEGWSGWSGTTAHEWVIAPGEGHDGKPALVIKARDRSNEVMVMTATDKLQAGGRYAVSIS